MQIHCCSTGLLKKNCLVHNFKKYFTVFFSETGPHTHIALILFNYNLAQALAWASEGDTFSANELFSAAPSSSRTKGVTRKSRNGKKFPTKKAQLKIREIKLKNIYKGKSNLDLFVSQQRDQDTCTTLACWLYKNNNIIKLIHITFHGVFYITLQIHRIALKQRLSQRHFSWCFLPTFASTRGGARRPCRTTFFSKWFRRLWNYRYFVVNF